MAREKQAVLRRMFEMAERKSLNEQLAELSAEGWEQPDRELYIKMATARDHVKSADLLEARMEEHLRMANLFCKQAGISVEDLQ